MQLLINPIVVTLFSAWCYIQIDVSILIQDFSLSFLDGRVANSFDSSKIVSFQSNIFSLFHSFFSFKSRLNGWLVRCTPIPSNALLVLILVPWVPKMAFRV